MGVNLAMRKIPVEDDFLEYTDTQASALTNIHQSKQNVAIWQRQLPTEMTGDIHDMLAANKSLILVKRVTPDNVGGYIQDKLAGYDCADALSKDVALIVNMFCCLFDVEDAGLRLTTLDRAMCPKFHVDQIPCRLVTTYIGSGTQWLENNGFDSRHLDLVHDEKTGLSKQGFSIKQMQSGDVALLKGSGWKGNEERGLVHRSPTLIGNERRLLLTLDLV